MSCPFIPPVGFAIGKYLEIPSSSLVFLHSYFTTQTQRVVKDRFIQFAKIEKNNPPAKQMMSDCESGEALRPSSSLGLRPSRDNSLSAHAGAGKLSVRHPAR